MIYSKRFPDQGVAIDTEFCVLAVDRSVYEYPTRKALRAGMMDILGPERTKMFTDESEIRKDLERV